MPKETREYSMENRQDLYQSCCVEVRTRGAGAPSSVSCDARLQFRGTGFASHHWLYSIAQEGSEAEPIGDAFSPRSLQHAILEGHSFGREL